MLFKSNTHFTPCTAQKEGESDAPPIRMEDDGDFNDSTRQFSKTKKSTKKSLYGGSEQGPNHFHVRLNNDRNSFSEIKDRNNSTALTPNVDLSLFDDLEENNGDFNLKVYLRRRYALQKKLTYFAPENEKEKTDEKFSDIIENEIFFNVGNFLIFLAYHFLFHFLFGPLTVLVLYKVTGTAVWRNQFFWGGHYLTYFNCLQYFIYLTLIVVYFSCEGSFPNINSNEIAMIFPILFLRIFIISIKYATLSKEKIRMISTRPISSQDLLLEFTFISWAWQTDECVEKELQATIQRTELDLAMFKFSFLSDLDSNLRKELEETIKSENKRSSMFSSKKKKSRMDLFADKIYSYEHMLQNFFDSDLSGYSLAKFLLKEIRKETKRIFLICFVVAFPFSLLRALLPIIYQFSIKGFASTLAEGLLLTMWIFLNFLYFGMNFLFLIYGVFELEKSYKMLSQLSNLLAPKQTEQYHTTKQLPTINFFCPISLKCWDSLHKVLRNYGAKFRLRVNYYLSIFLVYIVVMLILPAMRVFQVFNLEVRLIIVIVFETTLIFITLMVVFYKALIINDHYHIHMFLIKKNKNVLSDLLNLYAVYFEKSDYVPDNEIYKEGVFRIKSNVSTLLGMEQRLIGRKNTEYRKNVLQKEETVKKVLRNLINISDNIIEDLQFCAKYMPFKFLGISVNTQFIESISAALCSVMVLILQKVLRDKGVL